MSPATPRRPLLLSFAVLMAASACGRERALHRPGALALAGNGDLLVADSAHCRVVRFDRDFAYAGEVGERGIGAGELWSIQGLGVLADGSMLVVDHSLAKLDDPASDVRLVKRFAADGSALGSWDATQATGDGEPMGWPGAITQVPEGLVLGDYERDHLQVFTLEGRYVRAIYARPPAEPFVGTGFVRWAGGLLWVGEYDMHRVRGFTLQGEERLRLGAEGSGDGQFLFPETIDVAPDGAIIVSDVGNYRAVIFKPDGSWERNIVPPPARPGIKVNVADVRFDREGRIYLSDTKGDQVLIFRRDGTLITRIASW